MWVVMLVVSLADVLVERLDDVWVDAKVVMLGNGWALMTWVPLV